MRRLPAARARAPGGTIEAWWPEVLGFLQTGITNAGSEAINRTVTTAAHTAHGFRNLDNQRRRVRLADVLGVVARLTRALLERCRELTSQIDKLEAELEVLVRRLAPCCWRRRAAAR